VGFPRVPTKELFLDDKLRDDVFENPEVEMRNVRDQAKQTDLHQVLLWWVCMLSKRAWSQKFKLELLPLLAQDLEDDDAIDFVLEKCFKLDTPGTRRNLGPLQPAACRRLAQLLAAGLREGTRGDVLRELPLMPGVTYPFFSPVQEGQLANEGIRVPLNPYPIAGDEFKSKAEAAIEKAGLRVDNVTQRWVLLINEGKKGVGVQVVGDFEQGWFFGFYIGIAGEGFGRYSVATPGQGDVGEKCDAAPCKDLPLSWFINDGVPAPFINAAATLAEANIDLFRQREFMFTHNFNGKKLICIPMGVRKSIKDKSFTSWVYPFDAVHGCNMIF